ncbi:MAG TPA: EAL domain-containing protein [Sphingomicrobium sp.]|nr:EAL domain-containing protein [Sphingomicrobium sp.]
MLLEKGPEPFGSNRRANAIVNLGRSLRIEIVAEGVESLEQEAFLRSLGCQTGKGFLYAPAVPALMVEDMLVGAIAKSA